MSQKRKRKPAAHASRVGAERSIPGWLWLLTGMIVGAFVMFLIHLADLKGQQGSSAPASKEEKPAKKEAVEEKPTLPVFEFYDRLKSDQVEIPDYEPPREPTAEEMDHEFFLQVASFRRQEDADKVRAQLILLNMDANIETSKLQSGDIRYRVIVGPYHSKSKLAKARQTLVQNRFDYLTLKRPRTP